jgi:DNA-binding transcriptional MerR regulator
VKPPERISQAFDKILVKKSLPVGTSFAKYFVERSAMNIRDLISCTGIAERQVRYLIAEGFMPAPRGGRANAEYGDDHVTAIERYRRLRDLGFPPAAIKLLLQSTEGVPFQVAPGVTLVVAPDKLGSGEPVRPLMERLKTLLTDLLKEPDHADRSAHRND